MPKAKKAKSASPRAKTGASDGSKAVKVKKIKLDAPELFINRELSWLEFNDRVLREGMSPATPLLERVKFLSIVSSNLDEFFMIRVAALKQRRLADVRKRDISGMTASEQLSAIRRRVGRMATQRDEAIGEVFEQLSRYGLHLLGMADLTAGQLSQMRSYFHAQVLPALTPLAISDMQPPPILPGQKLCLALLLRTPAEPGQQGPSDKLVVLPVPGGSSDNEPRFLAVPSGGEREGLQLVRLEELIGYCVQKEPSALFPGARLLARTAFRVNRDADVAVDEEEAADLLEAMEEAVHERRRRAVVRLEISAGADPRLKGMLLRLLEVDEQDVYEVDGILDAAGLMEIAVRPGFEQLKYPDWRPQTPRDLLGQDDLWRAIQERDILLVHPYESFDPVAQMVEQAADDPNVLAIKQTLYRTSGGSPIVKALARAAEAGKQVTVLVELKARFEEAKNIQWARRLEDAGCYVIYGIAGFKTHAKALLIVRREAHRVRRYVHLSTGNYNDKTARLYSDIGLMSSDPDIAVDTATFFNMLTGYSQPAGWSKLTVAPTGLRQRLVELIQREVAASTPQEPGLIMAKLNSLEDQQLCQELYKASQAGVRVLLNVRGICCLRPGLPGVSDNIEVVSIIDRYLEHARILYFRNAGHDEVYLSSADWMGRNIDRRLEILFPIHQDNEKKRLISMLSTYLADNVKARRLLADGNYVPLKATGEPVRAQEVLYEEAMAAASQGPAVVELRPIVRPRES